MSEQKKLYEDLCARKKGIEVECQTECDLETIERLTEDVRSQEKLLHSQKELFETELKNMQTKEQFSRDEVIIFIMMID